MTHWEKTPRTKEVGVGMALLICLCFGFPVPLPPPLSATFYSAPNGTIPVWSEACGSNVGVVHMSVLDDLRDENARPPPSTELRRQGIHPHPGPPKLHLASIRDDDYWDECGWTQTFPGDTVAEGVIAGDTAVATSSGLENYQFEDDEDDYHGDTSDGFSDWYGYPPRTTFAGGGGKQYSGQP